MPIDLEGLYGALQSVGQGFRDVEDQDRFGSDFREERAYRAEQRKLDLENRRQTSAQSPLKNLTTLASALEDISKIGGYASLGMDDDTEGSPLVLPEEALKAAGVDQETIDRLSRGRARDSKLNRQLLGEKATERRKDLEFKNAQIMEAIREGNREKLERLRQQFRRDLQEDAQTYGREMQSARQDFALGQAEQSEYAADERQHEAALAGLLQGFARGTIGDEEYVTASGMLAQRAPRGRPARGAHRRWDGVRITPAE